MRIAICAMLTAAFVLLSSTPRADDMEKAKAAFERGTSLFHDGKYEEAALAFREANELRPNWKLLYNVGQSEAAAKRHGLALQAFEEYLSMGGDEIQTGRRAEVAEEIDRLRGIVGEIDLVAPVGAVVKVDGRDRGTTPLPGPMPVAAGALHTLQLEVDGEVLLTREVRVGSGRTVVVDADPNEEEGDDDQAEEGISSAAPEPPKEEVDGLRFGGWVLVGVGAATLIGSAITGGMALGLDGDLENECPDMECGPDYHDDVDRLRGLSIASDVMTGIGAAALAAGAVMVVISYKRDRGGREEVPVALVPVGGADGAGLVLEGRF